MPGKMSWDDGILTITIWVLFLGGLFGFVGGMFLFLSGKTPAEYGTAGIGAGAWLLAGVVAIYLRRKIK